MTAADIQPAMDQFLRSFGVAALLFLTAAAEPAGQGPEIRTSDVERFYALYDSTGGKPSAAQLQAYLDGGTDGLLAFAKMRNTTGEQIAQAIEKQPQIYVNAKECAAVLPAVKRRLAKALGRLKEVYPEASLPPVTLAMGRGKPVATADKNGVMVGLEALCAADLLNPNIEDRFVYVIAHEYIHVQHEHFFKEDPQDKVLKASLVEGGAEFIGELISGSVSSEYLAPAVKGREKEFETAFLADLDKVAVGSAWLYNHPGTPERPADLGYWVGYRIVKAYYRNAPDKRAALREIIELRDPKAFLAKSGWKPGIVLD
jgi:Predicted Zn-dependent protease (DUF2268)